MYMLAYESRSAYCLRYGGTCYISHSRWHDDVTRRCAESSSCSFINNDPRRARLLCHLREAQLTVPSGISRNSSSSPLAQFSARRIPLHTTVWQNCLVLVALFKQNTNRFFDRKSYAKHNCNSIIFVKNWFQIWY